MRSNEPYIDKNEKEKAIDIPSSRHEYERTGDINEAVISVQKTTGFEITPGWWMKNVGNEGSTEDILDRFDAAFATFVREASAGSDQEKEIGSEYAVAESPEALMAEERLKEMNEAMQRFGQFPAGFIEALEQHLQSKYFSEVPETEEQVKYEKSFHDKLDRLYPEDKREHVDILGVDMVACGLDEKEKNQHISIVESALRRIDTKLGEGSTKEMFGDVSLYLADDVISSGGQAFGRENMIVVSPGKMTMNLPEVEAMLDANGMYRKGDRSELVNHPEDHAGIEFDIVHEFGHILAYKAHDNYDGKFAELNLAEAPTQYGQAEVREDYAESWMYLIYGGVIDDGRQSRLNRDITSLRNR